MDTDFEFFIFGTNGVTTGIELKTISYDTLTFKAAEMFIFNGKVNGDIKISTVEVKNSALTDADGKGKFFDF